MIVMPSNNSNGIFHYWLGKGYNLGWLCSPDSFKTPVEYIPYACDNGRYVVWSKGKEWKDDNFIKMLDLYSSHPHKPRWAVVPDCVGNRDQTLREWEKWYPILEQSYDLTWAFCVQDGMTPQDVPQEASIIFVGGSFEWKWRNLKIWTSNFKRVHVGRVNTIRHLLLCKSYGVESSDGTGWFRNPHQSDKLEKYFKIQSGEIKIPVQEELILD